MVFSSASTNHTALPIMVNQEMQLSATTFSQQQPNKARAERVYRNTLAVSVVDHYLKILGITTHLAASDSWNPVLRLANDVADLCVGQQPSKLECRAVGPNDTTCHIPLEAQRDRLAYVIVQLDSSPEDPPENLPEALLIGFADHADATQISLKKLRPLSELPGHLAKATRIVSITRWLNHLYTLDWQAPESLLKPQQLDLSNSHATVHRAKLIKLNLYSEHSDAVLLLSVTPADEDAIALSIKAQLYPAILQAETTAGVRFVPTAPDCLLPDIKLALKSNENTLIREVVSRSYPRDNCIQIPQFQGYVGEKFSLHITAGNQQVEEYFQL